MPYTLQSKNTGEYVVTSRQDVNGDVVRTAVPNQDDLSTFLTITPDIGGPVTVATIQGFNLYVSNQTTVAVGRPLTWSDKEYKWIIRETGQGTYVITPDDGEDLYWVSDFGKPEVVGKPGKDIQPPQNEWFLGRIIT
ncbi:hypothetical protein BYT27DRAFT_7197205 [Phlegmacium glaucopus]|nr:hypothetical protein BYT27DRAFT_7197205 [Phlegmacium glaucopus]